MAHTFTNLLTHIIFSTKDRMPTLEPDLKQRLFPSSQKQTVVDYIANQEEHHRKVSFKEEFIAFLKKHEIEYDEKYLWA